jgi:hypothetical protein
MNAFGATPFGQPGCKPAAAANIFGAPPSTGTNAFSFPSAAGTVLAMPSAAAQPFGNFAQAVPAAAVARPGVAPVGEGINGTGDAQGAAFPFGAAANAPIWGQAAPAAAPASSAPSAFAAATGTASVNQNIAVTKDAIDCLDVTIAVSIAPYHALLLLGNGQFICPF